LSADRVFFVARRLTEGAAGFFGGVWSASLTGAPSTLVQGVIEVNDADIAVVEASIARRPRGQRAGYRLSVWCVPIAVDARMNCSSKSAAHDASYWLRMGT
jgi:hypothetical protein